MNKYCVVKNLGGGAAGSILLVREKTTDELYAVKKTHITHIHNLSTSMEDNCQVATKEVVVLLRNEA